MSDNPREWVVKKKELLSMIAIIKSEDQDSWGEGTGGSISTPTNVVALGGVACQAVMHQCQGVWICDQFNHSLLEGHEHYEPDDDVMRELWTADQADKYWRREGTGIVVGRNRSRSSFYFYNFGHASSGSVERMVTWQQAGMVPAGNLDAMIPVGPGVHTVPAGGHMRQLDAMILVGHAMHRRRGPRPSSDPPSLG
ncbi:hypothetical protein B0H17DRAFT_1132050 [Mycena rosella]|uniref:Uncharacterized protein n=1 Tax=Mycena rosella TaxID=1033263 RepID=A0AAD7DLZ5_MYCRO|nr:hypothetical protein B0H17DRAFT_1132050 [Mycena rosella]